MAASLRDYDFTSLLLNGLSEDKKRGMVAALNPREAKDPCLDNDIRD
jgi:hypothetical protein